LREALPSASRVASSRKSQGGAVPKKKTEEPQINPGLVWDGRKWRAFKTYEQVEKGKYKGFTRITFLSGHIHVRKIHIKRYPEILQKVKKPKKPSKMPRSTVVFDPKAHA
jgi:hypothetical protein